MNSWQLAATWEGEHLGHRIGMVNALRLSSNGSRLLIGESIHGVDNQGFNTSTGRVRMFNITSSEVSIQGAPARINTTDPFEVSFAFDNPVSGFEVSDILSSNATVDNFTAVNASTYTATITPTDICGNNDITINVPANSATNVSSNLPILTTKQVVVKTGVVAAAKDITVQLGANGLAAIEPEDIDNGSEDGGCNTTVSLSLDRDTFDCNDIGNPVTVTLTATQGNNSDMATAMVTVQNNISSLTAIAKDITVQLDANGQATINPGQIDNGSGNGCNNSGFIFISLDRNTFTCNDVGNPVTVTLTVTQGNNSETATALVTVQENPNDLVAIAKDITLQLDANGQATITPEQLNNGSSYGCGNTPTLSLDRNTFTCDDAGDTVTVTLTAIQGNNSSTATATVTVQENPNDLVAIAKDITIQLDTNGQVTISPDQVNNGSNGGCNNNPNLSLDRDTFTCSDVGTPVTVTLTATQGSTTAMATAIVTIEENLNGVVAIAKDITVQLDANGQATITPEQLNNGSFYGCGNSPNLSLDIDTFTCNDVGSPVTVSLTATQGNSSNTATALVTVENTINSLVAIAKDITVQLDANGQATINPGQIDNGSGSGCNSSSSIFISLDRNTFTCNDVGNPVTVVLTATQGSATATVTAQVTVQEYLDNLVAKTKDITVQLDPNGQATITPEQIDNGSSYGCDNSPTLSLDRNTFTCDDAGNTVTITLTATQGNNSDTATAVVTVEATTGNCEFEPLADFNRGISPNEDGIADTLIIEGLEQYKNNEVKIYNLSQRLLYSSHYSGSGDGWDGTHRGALVPVGSYYCIIDYNEPMLGYEVKMIYINY
ncbi:gliding motility-associated C-terminal domain-containing protein [Aquimarina sp. AU474]|uniref:T9SS type B sorting domain-containing protein n=1 Tax=Aquimarina sp. AU474 TaxID=2108529 RepID=UPI00135C406B|nr:gliding motility-associated C-terminal domain-containing protein [Aquimarina sp. AU474]